MPIYGKSRCFCCMGETLVLKFVYWEFKVESWPSDLVSERNKTSIILVEPL